MVILNTIGFTKKSAEKFFTILKGHDVKELVDIRIRPDSHLAGFAKSEHLKYFCKIEEISYVKMPELAPPQELMIRYRAGKISFPDYKDEYLKTLESRNILEKYNARDFDGCCFLCCEAEPDGCHRKILAEYIKENSSETVDIVHL